MTHLIEKHKTKKKMLKFRVLKMCPITGFNLEQHCLFPIKAKYAKFFSSLRSLGQDPRMMLPSMSCLSAKGRGWVNES